MLYIFRFMYEYNYVQHLLFIVNVIKTLDVGCFLILKKLKNLRTSMFNLVTFQDQRLYKSLFFFVF